VTPETVSSCCEKLIPGLMESIRLKHGVANPRALLSRAVAGVSGRTLVFTMPGSVRAVEEYLGELFPVLDHLLLMIRGVDAH
jgi:molybdopterin biosynthesis enzyme MoaB